MKFLLLSLLTLLASTAEVRAETSCEFLAQVAASEEAVLGFDDFQQTALLQEYSLETLNQTITESFYWSLPGDPTGVHVTTHFNGEECEILTAYALTLN